MRLIHVTVPMISVMGVASLAACSSAHSGSDSTSGQIVDSAVIRSASSAVVVPNPVVAAGWTDDERKSPLPELVHIEQRAP